MRPYPRSWLADGDAASGFSDNIITFTGFHGYPMGAAALSICPSTRIFMPPAIMRSAEFFFRPFPFAVIFLCGSAGGAEKAPVDFERDVRPILNQHCVECHGGVKQAADLSFIHRDAALSVIEPGVPEESILVDRIVSTDEDEMMPPPEHGSALKRSEINTIKNWIAGGAPWNQPWAYQKPIAPPLPEVSDPDWCKQPMDRYVLAGLDRESIKPSDEAPPQQWLRRVTLDLTGLPPTPSEHDEFIADLQHRGEDAYDRVVNRLLESPSYGERWASVWLDQIRYADSRGLGLDGRREIWKYRDWVIDALNDDMRFDDFTIKQIAGDLLPNPTTSDLVATAANRLTQTCEEGGTDDEEFRIAAVLDRVSTVWQTWQGITFGCVQCHSHPYDPLQHEEFYQFAAFFNNTADSDLGEELPVLAVPLDPKDEPRATELDHQIESLEESVWSRESKLLDDSLAGWREIDQLEAASDKETKIDVGVRDGHVEFFTTDTLSSNSTITLTATLPKGLESLTAVRLTLMPRNLETGKADSEWGFVLSHIDGALIPGEGDSIPLEFVRVVGDEPHPFKNPDDSLNDKTNNGFAAYSRIHYPRQAALVLKDPIQVPGESKLQIVLKHRVTALGAFPLVSRRGRVSVSDQQVFNERLGDETLQQDRDLLAKLRDERKQIPSSNIPIMRERPDHLRRSTHVFIRGLFLTKGDEVQPDVPAAFAPLPKDRPADRLALAEWLVSDDNPLTARVTVNRVWARVFGVGLVATEEDFGSSGQRPSNPQLLDHLATRFQYEQQWSLKQLLRTIVTSSSYRQDAAIRPELIERDALNQLIARGPRFRMPAEMVRDCALAVSGLLSKKMHGKPVHPPIPDGIWKPFQGNDKWATPDVEDPDRYRRSIYTYTKRSIPYPMFAAFDAPSREFCTPRRLRSNTPLQALMTLNDPTFVECSQALAQKMLDRDNDPKDQIAFGFLTVVSRQPSETELATLLELYEQYRTDETDEIDSLTAVASVLLNLDEITSK